MSNFWKKVKDFFMEDLDTLEYQLEKERKEEKKK